MLQKKVNLLVVDDDAVLRQTLLTTFSSLGYTVRTAADGLSALSAMRDALPDILLSDLQMPGMSGFELLYVVQRKFPSMRVVAMSAAYTGEQVPDGIAAHAFHEKGSSSRGLFQTINAMALSSQSSLQVSPLPSNLIWIARNIHDCSGQSYVLVGCPECLRTFPELLKAEHVVHESACFYCDVALRYAIVQVFSPPLLPPPRLQLRASIGDDPTLDASHQKQLS